MTSTTSTSHDRLAAAELLADARRVDTPERNYRVSRCQPCGLAFAWKGSAPRPGCPLCGQGIGTTTRRLRAAFVILEDELLALAERVPGGLPASIAWERDSARRLRERADRAEAGLAAGERELDEATGTIWTLRAPYDWEIAGKFAAPVAPDARLRSMGERPAACREHATKHDAKAATYERRLAKLGGAI